MKIALVHMRHKGTGGTERYLNAVATDLAERGHDVTIVCRSHEAPPHPAVRFCVLRSFAPGAGARMWAFARAVERHVPGAGYDLVYGLGRTWTQDVLRLGGGLVATQLEHARASVGSPAEALRLATSLKWRLAGRIEARALAPGACRLVIANSELVRRDVLARYPLAPETVRVIHNGADTERFHPRHKDGAGLELRRSLGFGADEIVVLFLGTGYRRKGLRVLLEAFAELAADEPRARLLVVGYDSARPRYERLAAELGVADRTRFLGGRRDPEVCYGAADLYALPTFYDPFANSTVEALASGLPVVTTETNGGSEVVEPDVSGSVVPPGDPAALAQALAAWLDTDRRTAGAAAARRAAEQCDAARAMAATRAALEQLTTPA